MPIDMNQLLQTFIDETTEMLQKMEQALLEIELANPDPKKINLIFRCIHSIKSGSAIFGLSTVSGFAHELEALLQRIRAGRHKISQSDINLFFSSIDTLRTTMSDLQNKRPLNETQFSYLKKKIIEILQEESPILAVVEEIEAVEPKMEINLEEEKPVEKPSNGWEIILKPNSEILKRGNDPLRTFRALSQLGVFEIQANGINDIPILEEINPIKCYLTWTIHFYSNITLNKLNDIFDWVIHPEDIIITPITLSKEMNSGEISTTSSYIISSEKSKLSTIAENERQQPVIPLKEQSFGEASTISIRVSTEKIDLLMNIIGELVITQSVLNQIAVNINSDKNAELLEVIAQLDHHSHELQENVMRIRMIPLSFIFNRLPRLVYDLATKMKKQVSLIVKGENTELDKVILEIIADPLLHLVRNAIGHGIELPYIREKLGKYLPAIVEVHAYQEGGNIIIDVKDDGTGLNKEQILRVAKEKELIHEGQEITDEIIYQLIFTPGFSTTTKVTDISGRGVGLDIVYRNVIDVGGSIQIQSIPNKGSVFSLRLPLTLAIMDCQLIKVANQIFSIPLSNIIELFKINSHKMYRSESSMKLYHFRSEYIPMIYLQTFFRIPVLNLANDIITNSAESFLVVVEFSNKSYGLVCDELLSQQQIVIKSIEENYTKVPGLSGATILGSGEISLIVDISTIVSSVSQKPVFTHEVKEAAGQRERESGISKYNFTSEPNKPLKILSFFLAGNKYGIDLLNVIEIQSWKRITPLPNVPPYVKGVLNLHGNIYPVIDLCERFNLGNGYIDFNTSVIVLKINCNNKKKIVGIIVGSVDDVFTIYHREIMEAPKNNISKIAPYIIGLVTIHNNMITLLDVDNCFNF